MYGDYLQGVGRNWVPKGIFKLETSSLEEDSSFQDYKSIRTRLNAPMSGNNMSEQVRQVHKI